MTDLIDLPFSDIPRIYWSEDVSRMSYFASARDKPLRPGPADRCQFVSSVINEGRVAMRWQIPSLDIDYDVKIKRTGEVTWQVGIACPRVSPTAMRQLQAEMTRLGLMDADSGAVQRKKGYTILTLNCEAAAIPSSTPGHFHLFMRKQLEKDPYSELMRALFAAKLIQKNFFELFQRNSFCLLLKPGLTKADLVTGMQTNTASNAHASG